MTRKIIIEIVCFLLIVLFFYTAVSKVINFNGFVGDIGKSPLLTSNSQWIAWVIPVVEIVTSIMLAIPRLRGIGLFASFGLLTVFTLYIIAILTFSSEIPCSCGGVISNLDWKEHLMFNVFFVLLSFTAIRLFYIDSPGKPETVSP